MGAAYEGRKAAKKGIYSLIRSMYRKFKRHEKAEYVNWYVKHDQA